MREWRKSPRNPYRILLGGYIVIIAIGTFLLMLPFSSNNITLIDALYTATSATCVTGLIVKNTALDFTLFGKFVILALIQIGGLGYMTISTALFAIVGKKISLHERLLFKESINYLSYENLKKFALDVLKLTLIFESIGFIALSLYFLIVKNMAFGTALFQGLFHSVSAFCNAGFSSFEDNLASFSRDIFVPLIIAGLFITGGLGFVFLRDIYKNMGRKGQSLLLHSKMVIMVTGCLIIAGTLTIFAKEYNRTLAELPLVNKIVVSFFHAVTPRTAGFNLIDVSSFSTFIILIILILMFVGASPGGTGGGIKTTTFALTIGEIVRSLRGERKLVFFNKSLEEELPKRAMVILILSFLFILTFMSLLLLFEDGLHAKRALFEVFSAFGTVGLSMGSTRMPLLSYSYDLSILGKFFIILTMLAGRVGILTVAFSLVERKKKRVYPVEEEVIIG